MRRTRAIPAVLAAMLLLVFFTTTAYALTVPTFTWDQPRTPTRILSNYARQTSNGTLIFDGVAHSPESGTFTVELQKDWGIFGWIREGSARPINQNANTTYHKREKVYVTGQYFRLAWNNLDTSGTYRIVLRKARNPKYMKIYKCRFDIQ